MRVLVLTSRYTATRDIIGEDFGRQTRLFSALKKIGNDIDFLCADYRKFECKDTVLHGINVKIRPFGIAHFLGFIGELNSAIKTGKYDFLIASSDPLWGVIGYFFAKKYKLRFIYDLHDNYETYDIYKLPFFKYIDRHVIKNSDIITTVSFSLKNKIESIRKNGVFVMQNGADTGLFRPLDKKECRKKLGLPLNTKIVAYTGSIQRLQGIDLLIEVISDLRKEIKNLCLVIAGRFYRKEGRYINLNADGVVYLGSVTQKKIVQIINAADVAIVPNPKNDFTAYCFPYKVVEYMACNTPIVATAVGDVEILLKKFKDSLCRENDNEDMSKKIRIQLSKGKVNYRKALENTWSRIASHLNGILMQYKNKK